jgi:uroporphyrinogen-III decarboxylase
MPTRSYYFDNIEPAVEVDEERLDPADNLAEFGVFNEADVNFVVRSVEEGCRTGRAVILNMVGASLGDISQVPGTGLRHPKGIRRIEEWYISPLIRPDYVKAVFDRQTDIAVTNLQKINAACGEAIDAVQTCGADFGFQSGQFFSPATFRDIWVPYYRRMNDWIHANTRWKVFKHCCGAVAPLIPCFIEGGFDVLNPVQTSAVGMDPATLKREFGRDIAFWGGGVDTQHVLPFGTPAEVRQQVLERCEIFGRDGGFIFNAVHNVQHGVPVENIVAMIDAVREFNGDPPSGLA